MSFSTFLIGTLLVSSLVLLVLLIAPQPNQDLRATRLPFVGAMLAMLLVALGFIAGFSVAG